MKQNDPQSA